MKYLITTVIALTVAVYSNMAFAWDAGRPYLKSSVGQFTYDGATSGYINGVFVEIDDDTIGLDASAGYPFSDYVAIEGGVFYLTEADWRASVGSLSIDGTVDGYGGNASTVLRLPLGDSFGILGKLGVYFWEVEATVTGTNISAEDDGWDLLAGVGADFKINDSFAIVLGYDHYNDAGQTAYLGIRFNP